MSQIDELQARIMEALDRIGRGVEARAATDGAEQSGTSEAALSEADARARAAEAAKSEAVARAEAAEEAKVKAEARTDAAESALAEAVSRAEAAEEAKAEADARAEASEAALREAETLVTAAGEAKAEAEARGEAAEAAAEAARAATAREDGVDVAALQEAFEEEKIANAQLEERVSVLHARLDARENENAADEGAHSEALRKLDADLQSLRKANDQLRESNAALRAAHEAGVAEPHLINKAMMAELEALRAARAPDRDEVALVLSEIDRAVAGADDQTEDA
jgi:chromosome segregation ATPase